MKLDQTRLQSISSANTDLAQFVQSCIDQTIELLSLIYGGHVLLYTAPDVHGSHPETTEGVQLILLLFFKPKLAHDYPDQADKQAEIHSEDFRGSEHRPGDAIEPGKCCFSVQWLIQLTAA